MANTADHYRKYQVYFFLYLAVICELLIVIVDRDDAEEGLLHQQRLLEEKNRRIILELLKNMPTVAAAGDNQLKVNESRYFTIRVKGLGDSDKVTTPPIVEVSKDGQPIQTLRFPTDIYDSTTESTKGERIYRFFWKADKGPGKFEFWVKAGTNRVELAPALTREATIKVGSLEFKRSEIQRAIDFDPALKGTPVEAFVQRSEQLDPARFTVEVISEMKEQLQIQADNVVTAVGFPTFNEIKVRGTTVDKVTRIDFMGGGDDLAWDDPNNPWRNPEPEKAKWAWTAKFTEPGEKIITAEAFDNRNAGPLSRSKPIQFKVIVKEPILAKKKPRAAYAGETFEMNINVAGLEDVGAYAWKLSFDGQEKESGTGSVVRVKVPTTAKTMTIDATYRGREYLLYMDSTKKELVPSRFDYTVVAPPTNIIPYSFEEGGEYPINTPFEFYTDRCGNCGRKENVKNVPLNEIFVAVEDRNGNDLLARDRDVEKYNEPSTPPFENGVRVRFFLNPKARIPRDGMDAVIRIRSGSASADFNIRVFPVK